VLKTYAILNFKASPAGNSKWHAPHIVSADLNAKELRARGWKTRRYDLAKKTELSSFIKDVDSGAISDVLTNNLSFPCIREADMKARLERHNINIVSVNADWSWLFLNTFYSAKGQNNRPASSDELKHFTTVLNVDAADNHLVEQIVPRSSYVGRFRPFAINPHGRSQPIPMQDRDIDVLFVSSFQGRLIGNSISNFPWIGKVDTFIRQYETERLNGTVLNAVVTFLKAQGIVTSDELNVDHAFAAMYATFTLRQLRKENVLNQLRPFKVRFASDHVRENADQLPRQWVSSDVIPFEELLQLYKRSKIVVNVLPTTYFGIAERILTAMSYGAVPITDTNPYIEQTFTDGQDMLFFDFSGSSLTDKIEYYLANLNELQEISHRALERAHTEFSVKQSIDHMLNK
jgi:glycosyltransferase involved in cell wall biosynthesis